MTPDLSAQAIEARLREASARVSSFAPASRLDAKLDLSSRGVVARLREASALLDLTRALRRAGR